MSEITREELLAFTEAHARASVALDKISERLADILKNQEKIQNGVYELVPSEVVKQYDAIHKDTVSYLTRIETTLNEIRDRMVVSIVDGVVKNYNATHNETIAALDRVEKSNKAINDTLTTTLPGTLMEKINNSDIAKDIDHAKLILGAIGFIVVVAVILLKFFFGSPSITPEQMREIINKRLPAVQSEVVNEPPDTQESK